jgi:hypothetical protein
MRTEAVLALTGRRVMPRRLLDAGFEFWFTDLDQALRQIVSRPGDETLGDGHPERGPAKDLPLVAARNSFPRTLRMPASGADEPLVARSRGRG